MKNKEITPFEEWEKRRLNLSYLRTWGCLAKVNVPINKKRKLGPKTVDCVFLGHAIHSVCYRFLIINSKVPDMVEGTIMESRDATFFEDEFPMKMYLALLDMILYHLRHLNLKILLLMNLMRIFLRRTMV
jgi:hypothetical protein